MEYIEIDRPPGWYHYRNEALRYRVAKGGLTLVAPDGKFLHVPFEFSLEALSHEGIEEPVENALRQAARNLVKMLDKLGLRNDGKA